jgi:hypothetical protein
VEKRGGLELPEGVYLVPNLNLSSFYSSAGSGKEWAADC